LPAADSDLGKAEDFERRAIAIIQSDSLKIKYRGMLKQVLTLHAKVLAAEGNATGAQAVLDEAAKL
jgi:hypothetical protein